MSGTVSPFSGQYFAPQVQPNVNFANWRSALAAAQQQAAIQRAQMQALQQQAAAQQQQLQKIGAIGGPASGYQPGQPLPLPGPVPIAGGGQGPMTNVSGNGMA